MTMTTIAEHTRPWEDVPPGERRPGNQTAFLKTLKHHRVRVVTLRPEEFDGTLIDWDPYSVQIDVTDVFTGRTARKLIFKHAIASIEAA